MEGGMERKRKMITEIVLESKVPKPNPPLDDIDETRLIENSEQWSIDDLVNIVEVNNSLANAARDIFDKRFGASQIDVSNKFDVKTEKVLRSVKLLTYFGAFIQKLKVVYLSTYCRYDKMLDDAIITNCRKTLVELQINNATKLTMHEISEPFENIRSIHFKNGTICDIILELSKWFPSVQSLELRALNVPSTKPFQLFKNHFSSLRHFGISNHESSPQKVTEGHIEKFIKMNPQLTSLWLENGDIPEDKHPKEFCSCDGINLDADFMAKVNKCLPGLESLHVIFKQERTEAGNDSDLHFKSLKNLTMEFGETYCLFEIYTDNVDVLNLIGGDMDSSMLKNHKNARVVNISAGFDDSTAERTLQLLPKLPNLKELRFPLRKNKTSQTFGLLTSCKHLTKLVVTASDSPGLIKQIDEIVAKYKNDWEYTMMRTTSKYSTGYEFKLDKIDKSITS